MRAQIAFALATCSTLAAADTLIEIKPLARASLTASGPWLAHPVPPDPNRRSMTTLDDGTGKRYRITVILENGRLSVYVDPSALAMVAVEDTDLRAGSGDAGAQLRRGTIIDKATPHGATTDVELHSDWDGANVVVRGRIPSTKLGTRFQPEVVHFGTNPPAPPMPTHELPTSFELLDAPGGKPFAIQNGKAGAPVTIAATNGGFSLVRIERGVFMDFTLTGWIATGKLNKPSSVPKQYAGVLDGSGLRDQPVDLYDMPNGTKVGQLWWPSKEKPAGHVNGWTRYDLATRFGVATVWAR